MNPTFKTTHRLIITASAAALCAFAVFPARSQASAPQYTVTDLGITLFGSGNYPLNLSINASGQVSGTSYNTFAAYPHAARWTGAVPTYLAPAFNSRTYGYGINASGQIAGYIYDTTSQTHSALVWTGTTQASLAGFGADTYAYGINDAGQAAGWAEIGHPNDPGYVQHAVRWTGTTPTDLGTLGGSYSYAFAINASGQVAGNAYTSGNNGDHAVRWTGTTATDLGTLGGTFSGGFGINASGQVVGEASLPGNSIYHAALWTGTTAADLGTLGGTLSYGTSINASGQVLGVSYIAGDASAHPFIYTGGTMYDLSTLLVPGSGFTNLSVGMTDGSVTPQGNSINDLGQIVAWGSIGNETHALLLTPTPEPASAALLLGGGVLLALRRRYRA